MAIVDLLQGAPHATTARKLSEILDISIRDVTRAIRAERLAGEPIASNEHGYFIARTSGELIQVYRRNQKMIKELFRVNRALKKAAEKLPGRDTRPP